MINQPFPWEDAKKILVTAHNFVDPDALGSILAFGEYLNTKNKKVTLFVNGEIPDNLQFLVNQSSLDLFFNENILDLELFQSIIVLDCGHLSKTEIETIEQFEDKIVNIDHHQDNPGFGKVSWIDASCASTSQMLFNFFKKYDIKITTSMANSLLAGIIEDTGMFKHSNTTSDVFKVSSELVSLGANISKISNQIYSNKNLKIFRTWGKILENAYFDKELQAVVGIITKEEKKELEIGNEEIFGAIDILNTCKEAKYAALFKERNGEVKVSLRTEEDKNTNVAKIASRFGGGGHKLSAGFSLKGKLVKIDGKWAIKPFEN